MLEHEQTTKHTMVLSLADLSVWCYPCEEYVHNKVCVCHCDMYCVTVYDNVVCHCMTHCVTLTCYDNDCIVTVLL